MIAVNAKDVFQSVPRDFSRGDSGIRNPLALMMIRAGDRERRVKGFIPLQCQRAKRNKLSLVEVFLKIAKSWGGQRS